MKTPLPSVGTTKLLELVSAYVPDEFINSLLPSPKGSGRRRVFSAAQLWRVHLLSSLTSTHSFNALVQRLPEQRGWRRFARLSHRHRTPDVRMLNEFRAALGVSGFRSINEVLVIALLEHLQEDRKTVAIIDSTDLPASTRNKKKRVADGLRCAPTWELARSKRGIHVSL